ncbi:acetyl/propionyl/methylcrotonyl-CoA carboxylase subunit alpha [Ramlibacter pallidus]|uniref:Biotin/lipoyl-binding protein n=1 Tax=Ramlibacter pallidus TaxID=2780087 RepID=A0ABR9RY97_9BURK|nr:biotin carboxylase N-terminal domain-containing protein [Ramlibacter pallidus]MBE7366215.1 biotin/lipoyl-binding protein [Ramlibacter pallidus]
MKRLLVANRGEIARRIFRTAHRMGLETVAVYAQPDASALHVREATFAVPLGGSTSADSYLRIDKLVAAARQAGADAIHPGYGFLSENAEFAQAVEDAGLLWVGPPAAAIRTLGNKSRAKALAQARAIPCLPGYQGEDQSDERLVHEAGAIGFPLMVKAAAGGGGRGMRLVTEAGQLLPALRSARSEAESAFGSGDLLLERALLAPRHVEIQVFADMHGNCIHLGERDCSVQRRHQKIIEETPSPALTSELRQTMGLCAVELARACGYLGAGTVEFLLEGGEFYLMEMNTRLQVEHPVTEMVTGLDLVEWQLRIAMGERLPKRQSEVRFTGHAIEVRLCAEDEDFRPHAGTVLKFLPPPLGEGRGGAAGSTVAAPALRFDHALFEGLEVPPYYDSMLGKLVSHASTRGEAIARLAAALDRLHVLGLPTNRRMLAACLRHPVFTDGNALVPFLDEHGASLRHHLQQEEFGAAAEAAFCTLLPHGAAPALPSPFTRPLRIRHRGTQFDVPVREAEGVSAGQAQVVSLGTGHWHVQVGAVDLFLQDASFDPPAGSGAGAGANELRAPFNGKVVALHARAGSAVRKGDPLLVLESMKLEHVLAAARDGKVRSLHVEAGQQVATSQVLVTFEDA